MALDGTADLSLGGYMHFTGTKSSHLILLLVKHKTCLRILLAKYNQKLWKKVGYYIDIMQRWVRHQAL